MAHQPGEGSADHRPGQPRRLKAKRLAEAEKRALQDEYFAHAEKAMDNLRAAKEKRRNSQDRERGGKAGGSAFDFEG